jgi:hypothetical protein
MLRRYGEQALQEDIRGLLSKWSDEIDASEIIWYRAGANSRKILWDYDGAILRKRDTRVRSLPFPTKRPVSLISCAYIST